MKTDQEGKTFPVILPLSTLNPCITGTDSLAIERSVRCTSKFNTHSNKSVVCSQQGPLNGHLPLSPG